VIAAANQDLSTLVRTGAFRRDLYHRLNEFGIVVPALRERRGDILVLASRFLELTNHELKKSIDGFTEAAARMLLAHRWPGNVRELRNVVRRAVLLAETQIEPSHLGSLLEAADADRSEIGPLGDLDSGLSLRAMVRTAVERLERRILVQALERTGGNKAEAARLLHVDYKTIHKKTKDYGILPE
jgi:two-component system, NtrC family, response regulator HydG